MEEDKIIKNEVGETTDKTDNLNSENTKSEEINSETNQEIVDEFKDKTESENKLTEEVHQVEEIAEPSEDLVNQPVEMDKSEEEKPKSGTRKRIIKEEIHHSSIENTVFHKIDEEITDEEDEETEEEENYDGLSREELVSMLEIIVKEEDVNQIKNKVAKLKVNFWKLNREEQQKQLEKFITEGGKKEDFNNEPDSIEVRYVTAFNIYKDKRNKYQEEQEKQKQENLEKKLKILEELKMIINSEETLKKTYDDFNNLQERWSSIGQVPHNETNNIWQNYHFLVEKFFDKVKINKELKDLDLKKNVEKQLELCEKAEELILETSILKSFKQLQKYHENWKEIGPVPIEKKEELWERFKAATDRINQRRREYYDKLHEEQEKNLLAKTALCEKAEQILNETHNNAHEWKESTDKMTELQKVWKTIGYAPKKDNNEIWDRFRNALNTFHSNKNEYFGKIKEEQINNYNQKINICVQAEAIQDSQDWKKTTNEFIRLQADWKNIGPAPAKYSDKIWKRFRAACDKFFENKANFFSNIDKFQDENLNLKREIIKEVEAYQLVDDNNENLNNLKEFQKKWVNIGHVPAEHKDAIYNDFRNAINKQFEKLKGDSKDKIDFKYKARFENVINTPEAENTISKELNYLNNRITSLKNDIKLWENNIGFLANSKNANILKEEFNKKIESAKLQLADLQEKQSFLNGSKKNLKK